MISYDDIVVKSEIQAEHVHHLENIPSYVNIQHEVQSGQVCLWRQYREVSRVYGNQKRN